MKVRYTVSNAGGANAETLSGCYLVDSNGAVLPGQLDFDPIGAGQSVVVIDGDNICSDYLDDLEPNTATVVCECADSGETRTDEDTANFTVSGAGPGGRARSACRISIPTPACTSTTSPTPTPPTRAARPSVRVR